ncbi:MAG: epoxyqueuosine reductase QueH [Lachnospiraceae bacterium]|nr:epoxyqueuosine reductase QueH [Lachnospiraceae bacterium]
MPNKRNYQRELDQVIKNIEAARDKGAARLPSLLLHSCCAPCSSYVLEYLSQYFRITVFYYNPNIYPEEEYQKRVQEQRRLIEEMRENGVQPNPVQLIEGRFDSREFYEAVRGLEQIPEGGERCFACFSLRLRETAKLAAKGGFDFFTTTLSISPLKNAEKLNGIGEAMAREYSVKWLPSDFKKKNGYKRSVELSAEYGLYRQDYCGCVFSKRERAVMPPHQGSAAACAAHGRTLRVGTARVE